MDQPEEAQSVLCGANGWFSDFKFCLQVLGLFCFAPWWTKHPWQWFLWAHIPDSLSMIWLVDKSVSIFLSTWLYHLDWQDFRHEKVSNSVSRIKLGLIFTLGYSCSFKKGSVSSKMPREKTRPTRCSRCRYRMQFHEEGDWTSRYSYQKPSDPLSYSLGQCVFEDIWKLKVWEIMLLERKYCLL